MTLASVRCEVRAFENKATNYFLCGAAADSQIYSYNNYRRLYRFAIEERVIQGNHQDHSTQHFSILSLRSNSIDIGVSSLRGTSVSRTKPPIIFCAEPPQIRRFYSYNNYRRLYRFAIEERVIPGLPLRLLRRTSSQ
ncbi:MAG: hypothetical protein JWO09_2624 [Bacteroidetes bacterium]|nr:hypothetical protein [Bacteroidota bacterium]